MEINIYFEICQKFDLTLLLKLDDVFIMIYLYIYQYNLLTVKILFHILIYSNSLNKMNGY